jgi:hypothetical protein
MTYPAHIIAQAREMHFHKFRFFPGPEETELLCEALTTTPSEEAMSETSWDGTPDGGISVGHFKPAYPAKPEPTEEAMGKCGDPTCGQCDEACGITPIVRAAPTPKPEPTEDHLRRAYDLFPWNGQDDARLVIARLLAERDALEAENHRLTVAAEGACYDRDAAMAERDAMQARGEGEPVAWMYRSPEGLLRLQLRRSGLGSLEGWSETPLYAAKPPGPTPTPDPDIALAREAADRLCDQCDLPKGGPHWKDFVAETLRALKLKGQAHD